MAIAAKAQVGMCRIWPPVYKQLVSENWLYFLAQFLHSKSIFEVCDIRRPLTTIMETAMINLKLCILLTLPPHCLCIASHLHVLKECLKICTTAYLIVLDV